MITIRKPDYIAKQGAAALLDATFDFLRENNISGIEIAKYARKRQHGRQDKKQHRQYVELMRAYEDMGILMSNWFSQPMFLDRSGIPLPLAARGRPPSIETLIRASRVRISNGLAIELIRKSPSVKTMADGRYQALERVFVLPDSAVIRAAFIIERYLETLKRNSSTARKIQTTTLIERSCHVSALDVEEARPILRDIKIRGTAFMDAVDGEIESCRLRSEKPKALGELGLLVFAWTRPVSGKRKNQKHA